MLRCFSGFRYAPSARRHPSLSALSALAHPHFAGPRQPFCIKARVCFHEENRPLGRQNAIHENSVCITSVNFISSGIYPALPLAHPSPFARPDATRGYVVYRGSMRAARRSPVDPMHFYGIRGSNLLEYESLLVQRARCRRFVRVQPR